MSVKSSTIGKQLKEIRQNKSLTLDDVSKLTDVSKPMLGQIERGQSSPTINTLWKISTGLRIPLSAFLKKQASEYNIVDLKENDAILESNGQMRAYPLFAFDPVRNFELFYIEFDFGCSHDSQKHLDGVEEYVLVLQGELDLVLDGKKITLNENQAIRFSADVPHSYLNPYEKICTIYNMIFYPNK
jgi:XRE family transcriptional regulator, regulator of sulfur utilization